MHFSSDVPFFQGKGRVVIDTAGGCIFEQLTACSQRVVEELSDFFCGQVRFEVNEVIRLCTFTQQCHARNHTQSIKACLGNIVIYVFDCPG
ncbi:hypothetical protein D3C85_1441720 [compost metagenome]